MIDLAPTDTVVFAGDSITDAGRFADATFGLGVGYPNLIAAYIGLTQTSGTVQFINRGVSGERIRDLRQRWQTDVIAHRPRVVCIRIGANDMWRRYDSNDPTPAPTFAQDYRALLTSTRERTDADIVLLDPFLIPVRAEQDAWREDLDPKLGVVQALADEFAATHIRLDDLFAQAAGARTHWSLDGIHPTAAGHALIAQAWLAAVLGR